MVRVLNEATYTDKDIQKDGFSSIKAGDKVKMPVYGMTDDVQIGDNMRVGPVVGKCVDRTDDTVTLDVEFNAWEAKEVSEGIETGSDGKKHYTFDPTEFNDEYFPRVDLSNKSRYKYYKYKGKEFAYDMDNALVIQLFRDDDEIAEMGNKAPYRELDAVGLSRSNWKNKEVRNEYLDEYIYDMDSYSSYAASDFVKNELPLYQNKSESRVVEDDDIIEVGDEDDIVDDLEINEYVVSYQYTPDEDHSMTGELTMMATSEDEAEEEFYKYHTDDYYILEISRQENDLPDTDLSSDAVEEAVGDSADDIDPNSTGSVEPAGNNDTETVPNETTSTTDDDKEDPKFKQDDDEEILVELDEDGSDFKEWTYTEDEIFDVAYALMNDGYLPDWEAPDIQNALLYADHEIIEDVPYIFTMIEEDEDEYLDDDDTEEL